MRRFALSSLRVRLLVLVLIALAPALGLMLYTTSVHRRLATAEVRGDALQLVSLAASNLERVTEGAHQLLVALAQLYEVRARDSAECTELFTNLLKQYPMYTNFAAATRDGAVFCSGVPLTRPVNVSDRDWFQRATETRAFAFGNYRVGPITGKASLSFGYPVLDAKNQVQVVVFADFDLAWLNRFVSRTHLPEGASLVVIDRKATILAHHPDPERWVGKSLPDAPLLGSILAHGESTVEVSGVDGIRRLYAFIPLRTAQNSVHVGIGISKQAAYAEHNRAFLLSLLALGLVGALAVIAAWVGGDLVILSRLNALVRAAARLSEGDLKARVRVRGDDEIGMMALTFNSMAERLAAMVAAEQQAKEALANRVNELVAQRTRESDLLNQIGELLEACFTVQEAYTVVGQLFGQFFSEESGALFVIIGSRNLVEAGAVWGAVPAGDWCVFEPEQCWALRRGRTHLVADTGSGLVCKHLPSPLPAAYLCIPLVAQGEALGVLYLASPPAPEAAPADLTEAKRRLAGVVAERLALALANLRLRETLRSQSIHDSLTGLFNRRYMEETLEREVHRAKRGQRPLGIIMLDIDHFKEFNDTFGHDAGDALLTGLSELLIANSRKADLACRYGGEEFILVLPEASLDDTRRRAEQLRELANSLTVSHRGQPLGSVTISLGVAAFPDHGETGDAIIRASDAALYRAKRAGRDQVVIAEQPEGAVISADERAGLKM